MDVKIFDKEGKLVCSVMKGDYAYYYTVYAFMFLVVLILVAFVAELLNIDTFTGLALFAKIFVAIVLEYFAIRLLNKLVLRPRGVDIRPEDVEGKIVKFVNAPWWYRGAARKYRVFIPDFDGSPFMVHSFQSFFFSQALESIGADVEFIPYGKDSWSK